MGIALILGPTNKHRQLHMQTIYVKHRQKIYLNIYIYISMRIYPYNVGWNMQLHRKTEEKKTKNQTYPDTTTLSIFTSSFACQQLNWNQQHGELEVEHILLCIITLVIFVIVRPYTCVYVLCCMSYTTSTYQISNIMLNHETYIYNIIQDSKTHLVARFFFWRCVVKLIARSA